MLPELRAHYNRHRIGALNFECPHAPSCRSAGGQFTEATESFVGTEYEKGTLPRLLFLSLDSGSGNSDATQRTLDVVRARVESGNVLTFPKHKHWFITHEMAWVLLRQFRPELTIATTPPYFAHVNSAKCCQNNPSRREAAGVLFENCRQYVPDEIRILRPDMIVTQGVQARRAIEVGFDSLREMSLGCCRANVIRCGDREALWIQTHHPSGYGAFWRQKNECWQAFASMVRMFVAGGLPSVASMCPPATSRLVKCGSGPTAVTTDERTPTVAAPLPRNIEELIAASRSIASQSSFHQFMERMRPLPGPTHQHVGLFSGMRVQQFQNWQLDENPRYRLTDGQLLAVMRVEFPLATGKVFTGTLEEGLRIVAMIRADYNRTGHNGPTPQSRPYHIDLLELQRQMSETREQ